MEIQLNLKWNKNLTKGVPGRLSHSDQNQNIHIPFKLSKLEKKTPLNFQTEHVKMRHLNLIQTLYFKFLLNKICQNDTFSI